MTTIVQAGVYFRFWTGSPTGSKWHQANMKIGYIPTGVHSSSDSDFMNLFQKCECGVGVYAKYRARKGVQTRHDSPPDEELCRSVRRRHRLDTTDGRRMREVREAIAPYLIR